jgi:beta-lactamase class A
VLVDLDGKVGLAVKDLGSNRGVALNGDLELPAASLFKVPVMYSVFKAGVPLTESHEITDYLKEFDLGTLEQPVGASLTIAEALERMVTVSDNTSAILLANRVGATQVNANLRALGMNQTFYLADRLNTSASDMLRLLEPMARGESVSPAASAEMVHLLLRQRINDRLPRLLPDEVQVSHKTGNLAGVVNDVGILYGPTNTIVVAMLVAETSDGAAAATAIAQVARTAYEVLSAEPDADGFPRVPPRPARPIPPVTKPTPVVVPSPSSVPSPEP